jgi:hypothetical protein
MLVAILRVRNESLVRQTSEDRLVVRHQASYRNVLPPILADDSRESSASIGGRPLWYDAW